MPVDAAVADAPAAPAAPAGALAGAAAEARIAARRDDLLATQLDDSRRRTDRAFAVLMICQWLAGIVIACVVSPHAWSGELARVHPHVWAATLLGGAIVSLPLALIRWLPGHAVTRQVVAVAQMLTSALLIHLTGGRIETHFHVFGSLAFLATYRDPRVLITASAVVAADHLLRGVFWPESVYGVLAASPWRWVEHTVWVAFEDAFLLVAIRRALAEVRAVADQRARLEAAAADLARSNAELEQFAYVSSHDLQEPLRMVSSYLGLLRRRAADALDAQQRQWIEKAIDGALRMRALIKDLLAYSRATSDAAPTEPAAAAEAVRAAIELLQPAIAEAGGDIAVQDALPSVRIAAAALVHVFQNLIGNALKYRRDRPRIRVTAERRDGECVFAVADDGIGIAPEHRQRVFELFQRLHRDEYPGTGIGLSICKRVVEGAGGRIWIEDTPGGGTTMRFALPAA